MKAARRQADVKYVVELTEDEALELHEFIVDNMRAKKDNGEPQIEVELDNALWNAGISRIYKDKWAREYDL